MRLGFTAWIVALAACGADPGAFAQPASNEPSAPADRPLVTTEGEEEAGVTTEPEAPGPDVPYAAVIQKSSHNSYDRFEPLVDQLVYHRIRSVELDIHVGKQGESAGDGDWFVYHDDLPFLRDTSCNRLSDCLGQLAAFHRAFPRHEVVTVWIDLKDGFGAGHTAADLDAQLAKSLGRTNVLGPEDAKTACPGATSLRDALAGKCTFPTLDELRGKFILAVTGGGACDPASNVMTYDGALVFRAPNHSASCTPAIGDDVFVNLSWDERAQATEARSRGLVPRIYKGGVPGGLDSKEDFEGAMAAGALHLATDKANAEEDTWSTTHDVRGFPFKCGGCENHVEPGTIFGLRATSGDLWEGADSAFFALAEEKTKTTEDDWSALTSVPSSHAPEFAKACLVARASESPGAPYAAACRTFDGNFARMQMRASEGGPTTTTTAPPVSGLADEAPAFLRLRVEPTSGKTKVMAEISGDGIGWTKMGTTELDGALPLRGLVVSAHDGVPVKALFADVRRDGAPVPFSTFAKKVAIGAGATGDAFVGVAP